MENFIDKQFKGKEKLIDVALEQFSSKGYVKASINDILEEAEVSKGTFYYHFKNKEELYFYLIGMLINKKREYLSKAIPMEAYASNDIFSLLKLLTESGMKFAKVYPSISKFSERFMLERGTEIYNKALDRYNFQDNTYFEKLIENAIQRGEFREDIPSKFIKNIIGYLFTHIVEILSSNGIEEYEDGFEYFIEFLKGGLQNKLLNNTEQKEGF